MTLRNLVRKSPAHSTVLRAALRTLEGAALVLLLAAACARTLLLHGPHRHSFIAHPDYEAGSLLEAREIIQGILEGERPCG